MPHRYPSIRLAFMMSTLTSLFRLWSNPRAKGFQNVTGDGGQRCLYDDCGP